MSTEKTRDWFFSFGGGHTNPRTGESVANRYVRLHGTCDSTREQMFKHFGNRWSFQYHSLEAFHPERYGMREIALDELVDLDDAPERDGAR